MTSTIQISLSPSSRVTELSHQSQRFCVGGRIQNWVSILWSCNATTELNPPKYFTTSKICKKTMSSRAGAGTRKKSSEPEPPQNRPAPKPWPDSDQFNCLFSGLDKTVLTQSPNLWTKKNVWTHWNNVILSLLIAFHMIAKRFIIGKLRQSSVFYARFHNLQ